MVHTKGENASLIAPLVHLNVSDSHCKSWKFFWSNFSSKLIQSVIIFCYVH